MLCWERGLSVTYRMLLVFFFFFWLLDGEVFIYLLWTIKERGKYLQIYISTYKQRNPNWKVTETFGVWTEENGAGRGADTTAPTHMSVSHQSINDGVTFIVHTIIHQTQILLCVCAYSRAVGVIQLISLHSSVSYWPSACLLFGWVTASIHQISKDKEKNTNSMYFDPKRLSRGPETKWCQPLPS